MNLYNRIVVLACKVIAVVIKTLGVGSGATWPGEIALRLNPTLLQQFAHEAQHIILIAGTNGKTTTAKMIESILVYTGKKVAHNASGANLDNGLVSAFLADARWDGKLRSDYFIFEVDEATLPIIVEKFMVHSSWNQQNKKLYIVLLNLFRDQLDRYGEVDTIAEKWMDALSVIPRRSAERDDEGSLANASSNKLRDSSTTLRFTQNDTMQFVINADDPQLAYIGSKCTGRIQYFGLSDPSFYLPSTQHATDSIYCPNCGNRLIFGGVYYSHLGDWACRKCGFTHPKADLVAHDVTSPLVGVYNIYNTLAAASVCRQLGVSSEQVTQGLKQFTPAFGRMETIVKDGKTIKILLSKNPTGFNESLRTALNAGAKTLLFVLNDRIPDGRDVSWIWDVDFEVLAGKQVQMFISGDRCYDMGLRIKYAITNSKFHIEKKLNIAVEKSLRETMDSETLWILPTYSAMLDVRKILTGRKIL